MLDAIGKTIRAQAIIGAVVAEIIEPASLHVRRFRIGVDISQCVQRSLFVCVGKAAAVIPLFPKVASAVEHAVESHRGIPVQPMHSCLGWRVTVS